MANRPEVHCTNCNGACLDSCQSSYKGKAAKQPNKINYSITMNGIESCSGGCVYCSAGTTLDYAMGVNYKDVAGSLQKIDEKTYGEFKADFTKLAETIEHNSRFRRAKEIQEKEGNQCICHIDIWGGDPVTNHLATQEIVDFLEDFFINKHGMLLEISSSTNGLPLLRNDICDYYREHNMTLQISHDGCGQWMRTRDIDPLYTPGFAENIAELFRNGNLNMINDCLNFYNNDVFANKKYYDDYFKSINMPIDKYKNLYIKLNRIYDGDYDIHQKNIYGYFGSDKRVFDFLKGKEFGDMRHHNWKNLNSGDIELDHLFAHELDVYLGQWLQIALMMRDPDVLKDPMWQPYIGYCREQVNRWKPMKSRDESQSICRRFQMTNAQVGDPKYWCKPNEFGEIEMFVIDTTGRYCECNLIDADHHVKNVGCATVPKQCPTCRFYLQSECQGCGSEIFTEDCEWRYRWVTMLEQVKYLDKILEKAKKQGETKGYNEGFAKGREEERINTGAAIVRSVSSLLQLPGYNISNNNKGCKCNGNTDSTPQKE